MAAARSIALVAAVRQAFGELLLSIAGFIASMLNREKASPNNRTVRYAGDDRACLGTVRRLNDDEPSVSSLARSGFYSCWC